jgi:hypothetical protein
VTKERKLPSWVIDWQDKKFLPGGKLGVNKSCSFSASGDFKHSPSFCEEFPAIVAVRGKYVGEIGEIDLFPERSVPAKLANPFSLLSLVEQMERFPGVSENNHFLYRRAVKVLVEFDQADIWWFFEEWHAVLEKAIDAHTSPEELHAVFENLISLPKCYLSRR